MDGAAIKGLFANGNTLVQAIVAAEVLAPPLALRAEEHSWNLRQPNEPSTSER